VCYLIEMFIAPVDWPSAVVRMVKPEIPDAGALLLTVGIIARSLPAFRADPGANSGAQRRREAHGDMTVKPRSSDRAGGGGWSTWPW